MMLAFAFAILLFFSLICSSISASLSYIGCNSFLIDKYVICYFKLSLHFRIVVLELLSPLLQLVVHALHVVVHKLNLLRQRVRALADSLNHLFQKLQIVATLPLRIFGSGFPIFLALPRHSNFASLLFLLLVLLLRLILVFHGIPYELAVLLLVNVFILILLYLLLLNITIIFIVILFINDKAGRSLTFGSIVHDLNV